MATMYRSPLGSLVPGTQGTPNGRTRRSWFYGTPHKEEERQEDVPILKLTYFTKKVMLCFDDVLIGKVKTRYLRIENPCDFIQTVYLEKFPFDKGFNVTEREWTLQGEGHLLLPITWCPIKDGNVRELVTFKFEGMHRLQIILLGTAKPAKLKKQRRTLGSIQPSKRSTLKKVHETKLRPSKPPWQEVGVENVDPACKTNYVKRKSDCKKNKNSTRNSLDLDIKAEFHANFQKDEGLKANGVTEVPVGRSPVHAGVVGVSAKSSSVHTGVTDVCVASSSVHAGVAVVSAESSPIHAGVTDVSVGSSPVHVAVADVSAEISPLYDEFEHGSTLPTEMLTIPTNIKRETVVLSDLPCSPAVALNLPDVSDSDTTYVVSEMRVNESIQCERSPTPTQIDCQEEQVKDNDLRFTSSTVTKSKQVGSKTESCVNSARMLPFSSMQDDEKTSHCSLEWIALNNKKDSSMKVDSKKKSSTKTPHTSNVIPLQRRSIAPKVTSKRTRDESTESKKRVKKSEVSIPRQKIALKPKKSDKKSYKVKTAMKGVAMSHLKLSKGKATAIPRHPMPFAAKNMFYDERWIEKQECGFVKWLNYILTPDDYSSDPKCKSTKVDAAKLFMSASNTCNAGAPSKEVLSLRAYSAKRRMSSLRRGACSLFQSEPVIRVIQKIESEVERGGLEIRKDKHVHADYGIKQNFLNMMLSYNPLWLRIGLETIYGEMLPIENNADMVGLSRFIVTRMLSNPDIAAQYAHPTVPALFKQGYEDCLNKFILKKFLMLVFFLDRAKLTRLIDHNPCLFCKDAEFKSSRMLLLSFSREYLKGEGDVTRHLSFLGYCVTHKQTPLDEFDFAVTNIATDLRCGVRLARIVELLLRDWKLLHELRVPAISRLQKIHNMEVAFKAIKKNFPTIEGSAVDPKAIVDGHREKTLKLLWTIIFHLQVGSLLNKEQLKNEISFLKRNKLVHVSLASIQSHGGSDRPVTNLNESDVNFKNEELSLLFQWCKAVCSIYNLQIDNFTVSFSDGRALCYLVHHYNPTLLPFDKVQQATTQQQWQQSGHQSDGDDSFDGTWKNTFNPSTDQNSDFEKLLENERANYKLLFDKVKELGGVPLMIKCKDMTNTIPDEKVVITYVTYLCVRLLDLHHESCSARVIQSAWRLYKIRKSVRLSKLKETSVVVIQRAARRYLRNVQNKKTAEAVVKIQTWYRCILAKKTLCNLRQAQLMKEKEEAAKILQHWFRCYRTRKHFVQLRQASVLLQAAVKGYQARKHFNSMRKAAVVVQTRYRSLQCARQTRQRYILYRTAVVNLQAAIRGNLARKFTKRVKAARIIQAAWRAYKAKSSYVEILKAAIKIQALFRGYRARTYFRKLKSAALVVQRRYHANKKMLIQQMIYGITRGACITIQAAFRSYLCRKNYKNLRRKIISMQSLVRMKKIRKEFLERRQAALTIQCQFRAYSQGCSVRHDYNKLKSAAVKMQAIFRAILARRQINNLKAAIKLQAFFKMTVVRNKFLRQKEAAVKIQSYFRRYSYQTSYQNLRSTTLFLQRNFRNNKKAKDCRTVYQQKRQAAIVIQASYRGLVVKRNYLKVQESVIKLQSCIRCKQQQNRFFKLKNAAVIIQTAWRSYQLAYKIFQNYQQKKKAIIVIQSTFRGYILRKQMMERNRAAVYIQNCYRTYKARSSYVMLCMATKTLQRKWRAFIMGRRQRIAYKKTISATIKIQSVYRGYQSRKLFQAKTNAAIIIQSIYRGYQNKKMFQHKKKAAILIQSAYRGYRNKTSFQEKKKAAIFIQSAYRGYQSRKVFLEKKKAVTMIQSVYRGYQIQKFFQAKKKAAILIQLVYRGYQNRKVFQMKKNAAILIQSVYKSHQCRKVFLKKKKAATLIQSNFRGYQKQKLFLEKKKAAIMIQSVYRGYQSWKDFQEKKKAAILIQSVYRGNHSRRVFHKKKKAALLIQSFYRGYQNRRVYQEKKKAAILIQSFYRGYHSRMLFKEQKKAAILIQSVVRKWVAQKRYNQLKRAALTLQVYYRAKMMRDICFASFQKKKNAAVQLQACFRRHIVSRNYQLKLKSAIRIQAYVRGFIQRKKYLRYRSAVLSMQRRYRAKVKGEYDRFVFQYKRGACIVLQSQIRGFLVRSQMKKLNYAACCIQAAYRCHRQVTRYKEIQKSTAVIQTRWRAVIAGQKQRKMFLHIKSATCYLQKMVRRYIAAQITKRQKSATVIQSYYRMYKQRKCFQKLHSSVILLQAYFRCYRSRQHFIKVKNAVSVLQTQYRSWKVMRTAQRNYQCTRVATIKMQALFRCNRERKHYLKLKSCVVSMQTNIRCKRVRKQFLQLKQSVIYLQGKYRSLVKCRQDYIDYHYKRGATIVIQAAFRGYIVRKQYQSILKATFKLQAATRKYIQQKRYQDMRNAVACLQLYFRAYRKGKVQRRIYRLKKLSAITIQRTYRRYACRKLEKRMKAAVTIQAFYRCYKQRQRFIQLQTSAMRIQGYFRCWQTRKNFLKMKAAAQVIQQRYKSLLVSRECHNRYKCMLSGFTKLQAVFRGRQIRKDLCRQHAATCIQAWFRMYVARKFWLGFRCNVIHLQALTRGWQARKQFKMTLKQHRAASYLQKTFKNYIALKRIKEAEKLREACIHRFAAAVYINLAAIRLQRRYRCFRALKLARQRLHSLITIQRWMKSRLQRIHYLKLRRGMVALQKAVRAHQQRRCKAAIILQSYIRMYLLKKQIKNINMAALYIQTIWRGYCVRKKMKSKKLKLIRGRCIAANKEATEEKKLCNRTEIALDYIMRYKQVSHILEALRNLGYKQDFYNKTCEAVYEIPDCIGFLVELIQMYREKSKLFVSICNLLAVFCHNPQYAQDIRRQPRVAEKIQSIHLLTSRKHKLAVQRNIAKNRSLNASALTISNSSFASSFIFNTPCKRKQFSPDWDLTGKPGRSVEDPMSVIELLMKLLQLKPK
ncbi:abnormal spindle-like microcephaly-associated protein homolog [Anneissia japonica]|uniref:abnormal spindle-like microcephaly-associated protein homolog n=1 Tax=Anneissia japonica TaxID=1529436 RepID=UPI00142572DD|nr:abnormal spindle-like microcephaly-associated protein homolog [Anneissia japonica]